MCPQSFHYDKFYVLLSLSYSVYVKGSSISLNPYLSLIKTLTKLKTVNVVTDMNEMPGNCLTNNTSENLQILIPVKVNSVMSKENVSLWGIQTLSEETTL